MDDIRPVLIFLSVVGLIFCALMFARNNIVYKARNLAANAVFNHNSVLIASGEYYGMGKNWELLESYPGYDRMMFDLGSWKFEHFYPDLKKELAINSAK